MVPKINADRALAILLGFGAFAIYLSTLLPDLAGGDPGEAQFAPHILGIMHAPGYPFYTLAGWAWSHAIQINSVAWRMNLFSAIWASLTVVLAYTASRYLNVRKSASLMASLFLAFSPLFWFWGTTAGIRSFTAFTFALALSLALLCLNKRRKGENPVLAFWALCLACGLGLAHHRTFILFLPSLLLLVWDLIFQILHRPRQLAIAIALFLLPFAFYLYIPIRSAGGAPFDRDHPTTLRGFLEFTIFWGAATSAKAATIPLVIARLKITAAHIIKQFSVPGILLGLAGLAFFIKKRAREAIAMLIAYLALLGFTLVYAPMWGQRINEIILIPAHLFFALWIGAGVELLPSFRGKAISRFFLLVCTLTLLQVSCTGYQELKAWRQPVLDPYRQKLCGPSARRFGELTLSVVEPGSLVIADWEQATVLWYLQFIEGQRPDVEVISLDNESELNAVAEKALEIGRPVYAARAFPGLLGRAFLSCEGPIIRLRSEPLNALPSDIAEVNAEFERLVALRGYKLWPSELRPGGSLAITLYWQALTKLQRDYSFSLRLVSPEGKDVAQLDSAAAVLGCYPTRLWLPGEIVSDYYEIPLPDKLSAGAYRLEAIVYYTEGNNLWHNLKTGGSERATVTEVNLKQ